MLLRVTRMVPNRRVRVSRCAEAPIRTPGRSFGPCGVQKRRFAHGSWVSGLAVCRSADSHTGQGFRVSRCAEAPIYTRRLDFGSRGVQKRRFAHRAGVSGLAVCRSADLHTGNVSQAYGGDT